MTSVDVGGRWRSRPLAHSAGFRGQSSERVQELLLSTAPEKSIRPPCTHHPGGSPFACSWCQDPCYTASFSQASPPTSQAHSRLNGETCICAKGSLKCPNPDTWQLASPLFTFCCSQRFFFFFSSTEQWVYLRHFIFRCK